MSLHICLLYAKRKVFCLIHCNVRMEPRHLCSKNTHSHLKYSMLIKQLILIHRNLSRVGMHTNVIIFSRRDILRRRGLLRRVKDIQTKIVFSEFLTIG